MKSIRIKSGSYGLSKPNSFGVINKTRTDPPFEIDDAEAKRLVELGVAEYATGEEPTAKADGGKTGSDTGSKVGTGRIVETLTLSQLSRLNKDTQISIAARLKVDLSDTTNQKTRGKAIWDVLEKTHLAVVEVSEGTYEIFEEAEVVNANDEDDDDTGNDSTDEEDKTDDDDVNDEDDDEVDDGETPPVLGADEPVD